MHNEFNVVANTRGKKAYIVTYYSTFDFDSHRIVIIGESVPTKGYEWLETIDGKLYMFTVTDVKPL